MNVPRIDQITLSVDIATSTSVGSFCSRTSAAASDHPTSSTADRQPFCSERIELSAQGCRG